MRTLGCLAQVSLLVIAFAGCVPESVADSGTKIPDGGTDAGMSSDSGTPTDGGSADAGGPAVPAGMEGFFHAEDVSLSLTHFKLEAGGKTHSSNVSCGASFRGTGQWVPIDGGILVSATTLRLTQDGGLIADGPVFGRPAGAWRPGALCPTCADGGIGPYGCSEPLYWDGGQ